MKTRTLPFAVRAVARIMTARTTASPHLTCLGSGGFLSCLAPLISIPTTTTRPLEIEGSGKRNARRLWGKLPFASGVGKHLSSERLNLYLGVAPGVEGQRSFPAGL